MSFITFELHFASLVFIQALYYKEKTKTKIEIDLEAPQNLSSDINTTFLLFWWGGRDSGYFSGREGIFDKNEDGGKCAFFL